MFVSDSFYYKENVRGHVPRQNRLLSRRALVIMYCTIHVIMSVLSYNVDYIASFCVIKRIL